MRGGLAVALVGACALAAAGCGREPAAQSGAGALSYLPARGAVVVALTTNLRTPQYRTFDRRVVKPVFEHRTEHLLGELFGTDGALKGSYARDLRPQLGSDVVVALRSRGLPNFNGLVAAFQARNPARLRRFVERQDVRRVGRSHGAILYAESPSSYAPLSDRRPKAFLAVEGANVVAADTEARLRRALARHDNGTGLTEAGFAGRLSGLSPDALFRVAGDVRPLLERRPLRRFTRLPWIRGIQSVAATLGVFGRRLQLDAAVNTDPAHMTDADLPVAPGDQAPALVRRRGWIAGASTKQSRTTTFLLDMVRAGFRKSDFVKDVRGVERRLGIDFKRDVLQQFDGPSASLLGIRGSFAARSAVRDPAGLAITMRRLRPYLGRLIEDLQGMEDEGLSLLLLFAPDAPAAPTSFGPRHATVKRLPGQPDFYRVRGLDPYAGPASFYFGLEKGVFVIGSSERRAKAMVGAPAQPSLDLRGGSVTDTDLRPLRRRLKKSLDFDPGRLGRMSGLLNSTRQRLRGSLAIELR